MRFVTRFGLAGLALAALVWGVCTYQGQAAGGRKADPKYVKAVQEIADAVAKGDNVTATKLASKIAKRDEEVYEPMVLFKFRKKAGVGVGKTPGKIFPDSIERLIQKLGRDVPSKVFVTNNKDALIEMAYRTAAISDVAHSLAPVMDANNEFSRRKPRAKWEQFSKEMRGAALGLVKAVKSGSPAAVKNIAAKLDASCSSCHSVFRD